MGSSSAVRGLVSVVDSKHRVETPFLQQVVNCEFDLIELTTVDARVALFERYGYAADLLPFMEAGIRFDLDDVEVVAEPFP